LTGQTKKKTTRGIGGIETKRKEEARRRKNVRNPLILTTKNHELWKGSKGAKWRKNHRLWRGKKVTQGSTL